MKSTINLYSDDLKPRLEVLTLPFVMVVWLIVSVLVVSIAVFMGIKQEQAEQRFAQVNEQKMMLEGQLRGMSEALSERKPDDKLLADIVRAELLLRDNSALLSRLNDKSRLASHDYPALMENLASAHHQNVWLKRILVEGEHVYLQGSALGAAAIPEWIEQLSATPFFEGVEFEQASFTEQDNNAVDFMLGAEPQGGAGR